MINLIFRNVVDLMQNDLAVNCSTVSTIKRISVFSFFSKHFSFRVVKCSEAGRVRSSEGLATCFLASGFRSLCLGAKEMAETLAAGVALSPFSRTLRTVGAGGPASLVWSLNPFW